MIFVGILVFFIVVGMTVFFGKKGEGPKEVLLTPHESRWSRSFDRIGVWTVVAIILIVIAYGPFFATYLSPNFVSRLSVLLACR